LCSISMGTLDMGYEEKEEEEGMLMDRSKS